MVDEKKTAYKFWNGKNPGGGPAVGNQDLIGEKPRTGKTSAKYEVANETVAAGNLQNKPDDTDKFWLP